MQSLVWKRYAWLIGGQTIPILPNTLRSDFTKILKDQFFRFFFRNFQRLEWVWDGDVEVGFKWTRKWVEKGEMVFPRTGHVSGIINGGDIWSCGGATSGEINPDTEQVIASQ